MEEKTYTIIVSEGNEIKKVILDGRKFVSLENVPAELFEDNRLSFLITNEKTLESHEQAEFVRIIKHAPYFVLHPGKLTTQELNAVKDCDYPSHLDWFDSAVELVNEIIMYGCLAVVSSDEGDKYAERSGNRWI